MFNFFNSIDRGIEKGSSHLLVFSVLLMLFMSVAVIVLRWFNITFLWFEPFIRHLVFLTAFLGGVIATGRKTHIGIDIIGKYFESKKMVNAHLWVGRMIALASFITMVWLTKASIDFTFVEAKYGKIAFLGIHSKFLVAIIPFGTSLLAYRFFHLIIISFYKNENQEEIN